MRAPTKDPCPVCGQTRPLLSIKAAAEIANVNRKTIYRWIRSGILEYRKLPSGSIRVLLESLLQAPRKSRGGTGGGRGAPPHGKSAAVGGGGGRAGRDRGSYLDEE